MSQDDLPTPTPLLRLVSPKPEFLGEDGGITWLALRPSSGDEREAKERGTPVRVSVWNLHMVSVEAVEAVTGRTDRIRKKLFVSDIADARQRFSMNELRVINDPLPRSRAEEKSVRNAHCAIEGLTLNLARGEKKVAWKARLSWLAQRMTDID